MPDRIILHCDLNNFFASVSLKYNPTLYDMPVAVCGSKEDRRGIVLAKNEIAKSFGIRTAEAIWEAKAKCAELVILPPIYEKYHEFSVAARQIYNRYTDMVEPFGIDECWLDVTGSTMLFGSGEDIADRIRNDIKRELGVTVSVGVSFNKIFAKLGSDMKKPDAITVISRKNFKEKVWKLPVSDLLFVGKSTEKKLHASGIFTIGDLPLCDDNMLKRLLGKNGTELKAYAMGEDNTPVVTPTENDKPKSIGRTTTEKEDFVCDEDVWKIFITLAEEISESLKRYELYAGGIQVHTRTGSLEIKEFSKALKNPTNTAITIAKHGMELFRESYKWGMPLRSVGIRAINLKGEGFGVQQDIFGDAINDEKEEIIDNSMYTLRKRFGSDSIKRGRTI